MASPDNELARAQAELQLKHYRLRKEVGELRSKAQDVLAEAKSKGISKRRRRGNITSS